MVTFHTKPGEKKRKIGAWMITAVLTAAILMLAAPLVIGAGYTYPSADDFIVEGGSISLSREFDSFRGPLYATWNYFMEWQGAYTSNILLFIPMPYTRFGLNGFRFCMVLISLFFVCSLYFMVHAVVEYAGTFNRGGEAGTAGRTENSSSLPCCCLPRWDCRRHISALNCFTGIRRRRDTCPASAVCLSLSAVC